MRYFIAALSILIATLTVSATSSTQSSAVRQPDFAFPKKVSQQAEAQWKKSLKDGNDIEAIRALMDFTLAQGKIDNANLPSAYDKFQKTAQQISNPACRSIIYLIQATILNQIYNNKRYAFDERQLPLSPLPDNWNEWSGKQFQAQILELVNRALEPKELLQKTLIKKYDRLLTLDRQSEIYYPTLYDFIANASISLLVSSNSIPSTIPAETGNNLLSMNPVDTDIYNSPVASEILKIYNSLISQHKAEYAPLINSIIKCKNFIDNHRYEAYNYYEYDDDSDIAEESGLELELYKKYFPLTEYSGDILYSGSNLNGWEQFMRRSDKYAMLKEFEKKYPTYWRIDCIKKSIQSIEEPTLSYNYPGFISPDNEFTITVNYSNLSQYHVNIYKLEETKQNNRQRYALASKRPVFSKTVTSLQKSVIVKTDSITCKLSDFGKYYVEVSPDTTVPLKDQSYNNSNNLITCTSLALGAFEGKKDIIFSMNPQTGEPVGNVTLKLDEFKNKTIIGTTDKDGIYPVVNQISSSWSSSIKPLLGNDTYGIGVSINSFHNENREIYNGMVLTDLPIYHPGDSVQWETIVYRTSEVSNTTLADQLITVILRNTNNQVVDSISLQTDDFGRAAGSFAIPKGELTGDYQISVVTNQGKAKQTIAHQSILVSDYKMPTFKVETEKALVNTPSTGAVTLKGRVVTYSGVGVSDTNVNLNLSVSSRNRYYTGSSTEFYADSVKSDKNGCFSFIIPADLIRYSPDPKGVFKAAFTASSPSGETQMNTTDFWITNSYVINAAITGSQFMNPFIYEISKPVNISLKVTDNEGINVNEDVKMEIFQSSSAYEIIRTDIIKPGQHQIDLSNLSPGMYKFEFTLVNDSLRSLSDTHTVTYTFFKNRSKESPSKAALWSCDYKTNQLLAPGESAKIIYGVPADNSYIFYTLSTADSIYEFRWIKASAGVHELNVSLPPGVTAATVNLSACRNFSSYNDLFNISLKPRELELKCESFRDNLTPGNKETWTFHASVNGEPQRAAIALGMFNNALESFRSMNFNKRFQKASKAIPYQRLNVYSNNSYRNYRFPILPGKQTYNCPNLIYPELNTYGLSFLSMDRYRKYMPTMLKAEKSMGSLNSISYDRLVVEKEEVMSDVDFDDDEDGVLHEVVITNNARVEEPPKAMTGSPQSNNGNSSDNFDFRDHETALAFFQPGLTTDKDGNLSFSFTVSNANATWRLNAFSFTEDLLSTSISRTFVANKPIMVTPNLPRFLRVGDKCDISSLVVNNTESEQSVTTTVELFNPISGETINSFTSSDMIQPGQNTTVVIPIVAPSGPTALGVKVKSSTDQFADGEQSLIPLLQASQPVIETTTFYLSPDSTDFNMNLPRFGNDSKVTLQYCDNPTWYAVTALPGLRKGSMTTPSDAAATIYSAAIAEGVLRERPAIASALREWTESDRSDSTLVSMLQRNSDLKTMLLEATPWVADAMNDTERMQRLALLFDPDEIKSAYSQSIDLLKRLQRNDGGWAWINSMNESSMWATYQTLQTLGKLNQLGYLPKNSALQSMIEKALKWHQSETEKAYRKYPKSSYFDYMILRDLWSDIKPSQTGRSIIQRETQNIVKNWKKYDVAEKSGIILPLAHNGYRMLANTVIKSILEYVKQSPVQGLWWPSVGDRFGGSMTQLAVSSNMLRALAELQPSAPEIDQIRQWLIIQKEAQNWGSSETASDVICSILRSSPKWISNAGQPIIRIGTDTIDFNPANKQLGYIRTDISDIVKSNDSIISIEKSTNSPSWGAIFSRSVMTMDEIQPASSEAVSISKRLYRKDGSDWVEASDLHVGDRVKISLLITANRDMQYVAIDDNRAACLEPAEQLPTPIYSQGLCFYRENRDSSTNLFITNMPRGTYILEYELYVNNAGEFASGIATIQSQYAPQLSAHSGGNRLIASAK